MKIKLWKGYHDSSLRDVLEQSWQSGDLVIVCPPLLKDLSFVAHLPCGEVELLGIWGSDIVVPSPSLKAITDFPDCPVVGVFTSGTTSGAPRLVLYSKRNIEASLNALAALFDVTRIKTVFSYPQPFHTFGLVLGYYFSIRLGAQLITPNGKYSRVSHELRLQVTAPDLLTLGTPTHFFDLIATVKKTGVEIAPSYSCIVGGAAVSKSLWCEMRQTLKIEAPSIGYGCTEASPCVTHLPPGEMPVGDGEIGYPVESLTAHAGLSGGVHIQGPAVCLALFEDGQMKFPKELVIRDHVRVKESGAWVYLGRTDLVLNRGAEKFWLETIEQAVFARHQIQIVCASVPDVRLGEDLAVLVIENGRSTCADVCAVIQAEFGIRVRPENIFLAQDLPINESSKIDRARVQTLILNARRSAEHVNL